MPPVLGPVSPSPTRLKSCAGASGTARVPSQIASTDSSGPVRPSSITTVRPASANDSPESFVRTSSSASSSRPVTRTPLPAASPSVLTTQGPRSGRRAAGGAGELAEWGGADAGAGQQAVHPRLESLQPRRAGARAEDQPPSAAQAVG